MPGPASFIWFCPFQLLACNGPPHPEVWWDVQKRTFPFHTSCIVLGCKSSKSLINTALRKKAPSLLFIRLKTETLLIYLNSLPLSPMHWQETTVRTAEQKSSQLSNYYPRKVRAVGETVSSVPMRQEEDQDTAGFGTSPWRAFTPALGALLFLSEKPLLGKGPLQPASDASAE